jgi:hypothetical protein
MGRREPRVGPAGAFRDKRMFGRFSHPNRVRGMGGVHIVVLQRDRHPGEQSVCDERSGSFVATPGREFPANAVNSGAGPALPAELSNFTQQDAPQPLHCLGVELADACF